MRALLRTGLSAVMALALVVPLAVEAQQTGSVGGRVTDADTGRPLEGAQVIIVGTQRGTLTNADGLYQFVNVPAGTVQVRIINLGYASQARTVQVEAGETARANFELQTSAVSLDEIVVTATGERRARELANAVGTLNTDDVTSVAPVQNVLETLQGRVPGVNIQGGSGAVGGSQTIRIRGNSSLSLSNTPLIYVDGVRIDNDVSEGINVGGQQTSRLNDINPNDIERMEVVRGPAAAALYGTEASAGVIRIFTKQGRVGEPQFTVRSSYGINRQDNDFPSQATNINTWYGFGADTVYTTNLLETFDPFRDGDIETLAGSVRGGTDLFSYYVSGEYQHEEGTLPNNHADRYYGRGNFTIRPTDEVDLQVSAGYTSNYVAMPDNDNNAYGFMGVALLSNPDVGPIHAADPNTGGEAMLTCPYAREYARATGDPLADATALVCPQETLDQGYAGNRFSDIATQRNRDDVERFTGSVTLNWRPLDFMSNRFSIGYDGIAQRTHWLVPVHPEGAAGPFGTSSLGSRGIENQVGRNLSLDYVGTINLGLTEDLTSETSFGLQYYRTVYETAGSSGLEFPAGATTVSNAVDIDGWENYFEEKTLGLFVQEQLGWRDRLFLTPSVRFDDNSAFGQDFDVAVYPSVGLSYIITDEAWFPQTGFLDQGKLRVSWGRSGKQPGPTAALQTFNTRNVAFRGTDLLSITPANPGNAELEPETGEEWEVGFDLSLMGGRIGVDATYYDQTTNDALVSRPLAPSSGFSSSQWVNIGEMHNSGIELALNALVLDRENFSWDVNFNVSTNDNEITRLEEPIIYGLGGSSQRHAQGQPYGAYVAEELSVDENGNVIEGDEVFLGQPTPEIEAGLATTFTFFRNLSLYAFFDYAGGHQQFNSTEEFRCGFAFYCEGVWEMDAEGNLTDEALMRRYAANNGIETPWIEDADFIKLRTVSLRYRLPTNWADRIGAAGASITLAGQNLATWTDYTGLDPEINFAGSSGSSMAEFLTLPQAKRYQATLEITF